MNEEEILAQIKEAIFTIFDYNEEEKGPITKETSLQGEAGLGADSLDLVELIQELEDKLGGTIEDDQVRDIKTIGDIVERRSARQEEEPLEDEPDLAAAQGGHSFVVELGGVGPLDQDSAAGRTIEGPHHVQHG